MTYAFTHEEIFPYPSSSSGWDLGLWAEIEALGLGCWATGLRFGSQGWILSLRLGFRVRG